MKIRHHVYMEPHKSYRTYHIPLEQIKKQQGHAYPIVLAENQISLLAEIPYQLSVFFEQDQALQLNLAVCGRFGGQQQYQPKERAL